MIVDIVDFGFELKVWLRKWLFERSFLLKKKHNVHNPFSVFFLLLTLKKQKKWGQGLLIMGIIWMGGIFVLISLQVIC